jgi:hypothetical protein
VYSILSHGRVTHRPGLYKLGLVFKGILLDTFNLLNQMFFGCLIWSRNRSSILILSFLCIFLMMPAATRSQPPPEQPAPEGMDIDPPPDQNSPLQPNASGAQNSNEPPNSLMQLLDTWIPQNAPLSDRVAALDKVTKLMEFTKPQVAFSHVKLPTFSGNDDLHGTEPQVYLVSTSSEIELL